MRFRNFTVSSYAVLFLLSRIAVPGSAPHPILAAGHRNPHP